MALHLLIWSCDLSPQRWKVKAGEVTQVTILCPKLTLSKSCLGKPGWTPWPVTHSTFFLSCFCLGVCSWIMEGTSEISSLQPEEASAVRNEGRKPRWWGKRQGRLTNCWWAFYYDRSSRPRKTPFLLVRDASPFRASEILVTWWGTNISETPDRSVPANNVCVSVCVCVCVCV